jgi:hypothetical protein
MCLVDKVLPNLRRWVSPSPANGVIGSQFSERAQERLSIGIIRTAKLFDECIELSLQILYAPSGYVGGKGDNHVAVAHPEDLLPDRSLRHHVPPMVALLIK